MGLDYVQMIEKSDLRRYDIEKLLLFDHFHNSRQEVSCKYFSCFPPKIYNVDTHRSTSAKRSGPSCSKRR